MKRLCEKTSFYRYIPIIIIFILMTACTDRDKNYTYISIDTDKGDIVVKLYNDTPKHRDNFIKLVKEGYYDGLLSPCNQRFYDTGGRSRF